MVSSIGSMNTAVSFMRNSGMQRQPPSSEKDAFKLSDTDGNGVVSSTELETLIKGIEKVTGATLDQDTLTSFDADGDGGLNGEELLGLMQSNGFSMPEMLDAEGGDKGMRPPPPPQTEQALSTYAQNSGNDLISQLMEILQNGTGESEVTSINITS